MATTNTTHNYVPNIYAAVLITLTVATVALVLRLKARRITKVQLWYDDYLCILAFIAALGYSTSVLVWTNHFSLGQSIAGFSQGRKDYVLEKSRLTLWIGGFCYASSIGFSKLSVLSFYWRIFQFTSIRHPIRILLVAVSIWLTLRTFMIIFQCIPVKAYWDHNVDGAQCRINPSRFFVGTIITHCVMDIIILILPIVEVVKMHLTFGQKIAIISLFTSGVIVCVASILVVVESYKYDPNSPEMPLDSAKNLFWAAVETNMAVFSSCLPMLRSIFSKAIPTLLASIRGRSIHDPHNTFITAGGNAIANGNGTANGNANQIFRAQHHQKQQGDSSHDEVEFVELSRNSAEDGDLEAGNGTRWEPIRPKNSRDAGGAEFL